MNRNPARLHPQYIEFRFPADKRFVGNTRRRLETIFSTEWDIRLSDPIQDFLNCAVGEAITNAILHGSASVDSVIGVTARYCPVGIISVEVTDTGTGFDTKKPLRVEVIDGVKACYCGRFLMIKCSSRVEYERRNGGFACMLTKVI